MDDITTISLEELIENVDEYKNQKVRVNEFAFFTNSTMIYDDYCLQIGPRGGVTVCYGGGKSLTVGLSPFKDADPEEGVWFKASGSYYKSLIFPTRKEIPRVLTNIEKSMKESVKQYKQTYDRAKARLDKVAELVEEYPEYSL